MHDTMRRPRAAFVSCAAALLATACGGGDATESAGPWMRAGEVGAMTAAYFTVPNAGPDTLRLVAVEVDAAERAAFHETLDSAGTARMEPRDTVTIAPGDSAVLAPRGLHVMVHGLRVKLVVGDTVVVRVLTSRPDTILVAAVVRE
jgi:copper(I)-binding protein